MFIKHGDGKITDIVKAEELTEKQKEVIKKNKEKENDKKN